MRDWIGLYNHPVEDCNEYKQAEDDEGHPENSTYSFFFAVTHRSPIVVMRHEGDSRWGSLTVDALANVD